MRYATSFATVLVLAALAAGDATAQWNVARFDAQRSRAYTTFGLDPAMITTVGYGRVVGVGGHDVQLTGDAGVAGGRLELRDFRVRLGAQTSLLRWRELQLTGSATFITRGTENSIYRGVNFGADFTGSAGLYRDRWFAAAEGGFDKAIITHIAHTDYYRDNYYADARDGWYLDAGGIWHYGLAAGVALGRAELAGRFGWRKSQDYQDVNPPVYASLGIGFGF